MKKKLLISSILSVIMCVSLIVGATFALFTSEDSVNIAVTSGEVSVTAEIADTQYKTLGEDYVSFTTSEVNLPIGGKISIVDGQITFDKILPGDGIKFNVNVVNGSNVTVKYRTIISNADGSSDVLFSALKVKVNGSVYYGKTATKWAELTEGNNGDTFAVEIELPEEVSGSQYMAQTCKFNILVQAVQGNADTVDEVFVTENVELDADNKTTEDIVIGELESASAKISQGTKVGEDDNSLTLIVTLAENANVGNFVFDDGEGMLALDIKMKGLDENNTTPVVVTLKDYLEPGLDGVALFHSGVPMTSVSSEEAVDSDGEFYYDPTNGYVTFATISFSNFTIVTGAQDFIVPEADITLLDETLYPTRDDMWVLEGTLGGIDFPDIREDVALEKAFVFSATQDAEVVANSQYKDWLCDFVISCDQDVALGELGLSGQYGDANIGGETTWYTFGNPIELKAGEKLPMLTSFGFPFTYYDICDVVKVFSCGIFRGQNNKSMVGKTITVSLAIADINAVPDADSIDDFSEEDGTLKIISSIDYTFTFDGAIVSNFDDLKVALESGKNVCLAGDIVAPENTEISIAKDAKVELDLNTYSITSNYTNRTFAVSGELTVSNGSITLYQPEDASGSAAIFSLGKDAVLNLNNTTLEIDGGTIQAIATSGSIVNINEGSKIIAKGSGWQMGIFSMGNDVVNLNGGEIIVDADPTAAGRGIYTYGSVTLNANSGKITVNAGYCCDGFGTITVNLNSNVVISVADGVEAFNSNTVVNNV